MGSVDETRAESMLVDGMGVVEPSRYAQFEALTAAENKIEPCHMKLMTFSSITTVKDLILVRYSTDSKLLESSGTCRTLVNSTACFL